VYSSAWLNPKRRNFLYGAGYKKHW
jgi:hypothetical protein